MNGEDSLYYLIFHPKHLFLKPEELSKESLSQEYSALI